MSISEQVKELREAADWDSEALYQPHLARETLLKAADTIESLSAKLQEKNEELNRWHTDHINEKIKNPFAWTSTLICHNCDHKDEYIEELEAELEELKAANMDRSVEDCGGGWIYCGNGKNMPEEHESIFTKLKGTDKWNNAMFAKTSNEVNVTVEYEDGKRTVKTLHTIDGRWNGGNRGLRFKVIAWQPLPEPYHEP